MSQYKLTHLQLLETESIHVMREVAAEFQRPTLMFSGGKDSIVMLRLAEKAFRPAKIPFPFLNIDTGHNFPELNDFRDRRAADLGATTACKSPPCWRPSRSSSLTRPLAAPAATRRKPAPRSAFSPSATSSANGSPSGSGRNFGTFTTAA